MAQAQATAGSRTRKVIPAPGYGHESIAEVYDGYAATGNTTEWAYEQVQGPLKQPNTEENAGNASVDPLTSIRGLTQEQAESSGPNCREVLLQDWHKFRVMSGAFVRKHFTKKTAKSFVLARLPVISWLPKYTLAKFWADSQAGVVVGCMLIPQGMGYADVAGLPIVAGLYSGFAPLIVYSVLGTSRQMGVGPVAIVSLLMASGIPACNQLCPNAEGVVPEDPYPMCPTKCASPWVYNDNYWTYATVCALMVGIIQTLAAPLLGFIMNFVPHPVISGFTSASGCIIAMSQLKEVMGYSIRKDRLQDGVHDFFVGLQKTHIPTFLMGFTAIFVLVFMRALGQGKILCWKPKFGVHKYVRMAANLPWAFLLVVAYTAATYLLRADKLGVKVTGKVPSGLPNFSMPANFVTNFPKLISITVQIIIIGYLESIAVETKFAVMFGYQINPTQEGVALGLANVMAGLTSSYPVVGSFSRSAVNAAYKSQSPMCNMVTGVVIMCTLLFLTPLFTFMPKVILASIVITAALSLLDFHEPVFLWRSSKKEFFLLLTTFSLTAFVALELGIYIAVALCGLEVLYKSTRPKVLRLSDKVLLIYLPGAAGLGREEATDAMKLPQHLENVDILVLEIVDTTALGALIALVEEIEQRKIAVFIVGVPAGLLKYLEIPSIKEKLKGVDIKEDMLQVQVFGNAGTDEGAERVQLIVQGDETTSPRLRYQTSLEHAVDAAIREDGVIKGKVNLPREVMFSARSNTALGNVHVMSDRV